MSDSSKNARAALKESLRSLQMLVLVASVSAAVVFLFGWVFHP